MRNVPSTLLSWHEKNIVTFWHSCVGSHGRLPDCASRTCPCVHVWRGHKATRIRHGATRPVLKSPWKWVALKQKQPIQTRKTNQAVGYLPCCHDFKRAVYMFLARRVTSSYFSFVVEFRYFVIDETSVHYLLRSIRMCLRAGRSRSCTRSCGSEKSGCSGRYLKGGKQAFQSPLHF